MVFLLLRNNNIVETTYFQPIIEKLNLVSKEYMNINHYYNEVIDLV